jgi:hypothetical protein
MDTTTVLTIIEMIDARFFNLQQEYELKIKSEESYYRSRHELLLLKDHLQQCIEAQLNAEENKTVE